MTSMPDPEACRVAPPGLAASLAERYGTDRTRLLDIVQGVQDAAGYLSADAVQEIASSLGIHRVDVEDMVSFYAFFDRQPGGARHGGGERHAPVDRRSPQPDRDAVRRGRPSMPLLRRQRRMRIAGARHRLGMVAPVQRLQWPARGVDATHPDIILDHDRCILCSRCIRASRMEDGKTVFGFGGRGIVMRLNVDAEGGLGDTQMAAIDKAASVCPVACIVIRRDSYAVPNGRRRYDTAPIGSDIEARRIPPNP